ncbi:MAG: hypothetical protein RO257_13015 [Candidatus Kapabacteria bacterium]|nr:hypothetical protein [Candidatus Kapabacteria bacterium]
MKFRLLSVLILAVITISCNEENPDLVNPPDKTGSVRFRFLNLGYDKKSKEFEVTEGKKTATIDWLRVSISENPPADTGFVRVNYNNAIEFEQTALVRFLRNTNYTYVGLSSAVCGDRTNCKIDTLIALRTTAAIPDNNFEALIKFMNAFPDTNSKFSIRLGCPNGDMLFGQTNYKQYSISPLTVRSGQFNFSVIQTKLTGGIPENIYLNLYTTNLLPKGQYVILAHEDENGDVKISILNENDLTVNALQPAEIVPLRTTEIRTINLSAESLAIETRDGTIIDPDVPGMTVDEFRVVETCKSSSKDTIDIKSSGIVKSYLSTSLEVLTRYSIVVFDSADVKSVGSILIEPLKLNTDVSGKAVLRVINTLEGTNGINVSIGARKENDRTKFPNGFSSGISLGRALSFGDISNANVMNPGPAPINVFTSSEPSRLLFAANTVLEADKSYLVIVTKDDVGNIKVTIVDEDDESKNIEYLQQGVFFQLVNANSDNSTIKVTINSTASGTSILENADLHITNSLATVIDANSQTIYINGNPYQADAGSDERIMMITGGTTSDLSVTTNKSLPLASDQNNIFRFRFVNVTTDIPLAMLKKSDKDSIFVQGVERNTFSPYSTETREQKPTYFFYDGEVAGYLARFSDVVLSLGKSYCIIFYGNTEAGCIKHNNAKEGILPTCYSVILQQEF